MLQCYVLMCGRLVTAILAPPRSQRRGQGPRSPHPKAGPRYSITLLRSFTLLLSGNFFMLHTTQDQRTTVRMIIYHHILTFMMRCAKYICYRTTLWTTLRTT
jgi:hypothetical protein